MKEVKISISLTPNTQVLHYNSYLSVKALKQKVKSLKDAGMTYSVICVYTGTILASN